MRLSDLRPASGARTPRTRVGRGHGSGHVKTSGRGQKGQKARTGGGVPAYFEGGQNRFSQRMPYVNGFKNLFRKEYATVNLTQLAKFDAGSEITAETLASRGLLRGKQATGLLKILGDGTLDHALNVTAHKFTETARAKIEAAGGKVTVIELKTYPKTKRAKKGSQPEAATSGARA
jgi:large subunit ribosomal protein L15